MDPENEKERSNGGRPSKRTPEVAARLCEAVRRGLSYKHACQVARCSFPFFSRWRGNDPEFREQLELAIAEGVEARLRIIEEAAKTDWRAALALLRIQDQSGEYTNKHKVEHQHLHLNADKVLIYLPQKANAKINAKEIEDGSDEGDDD